MAGWLRGNHKQRSWHLQDVLPAVANYSKVLCTCHCQPAFLKRGKLDRITIEADAKAHSALELAHAKGVARRERHFSGCD